MNRVIPIVLSVTLIILAGCGEEDVPSPRGSITGRILLTDGDGQIRAYALEPNEYVIFQDSSEKVSGTDLVIFVDFPTNKSTHLLQDGYFQIRNVEPGTHELNLAYAADVVIAPDPGTLPGDNYAKIDVPAYQWTITVEPYRSTTMGSLVVPIPDLEWKSGETGQEIIVPLEPGKPNPPVISTRPSGKPLVNPDTIADGHVWLFDDVSGNEVSDESANDLSGTITGDPQVAPGLSGRALKFNGVDDGVSIPDSDFINVTNGPFANRTVMAVFNCADVSRPEKQTIFEEGGRTRGLVIYVFDGEVYVGGWNRAEYDWNPGSWISSPIRSNTWYSVALVIRDAGDKVELDKFEMWLNGQLIDKEPGGQLYNHANNNAIGYTQENAVFHDDDGSGDGWYFEGLIDEVWVLNEALTEVDFRLARLSVEPADKLAAAWGAIKTQR